jgi:hypothetical protein
VTREGPAPVVEEGAAAPPAGDHVLGGERSRARGSLHRADAILSAILPAQGAADLKKIDAIGAAGHCEKSLQCA